MRPRRILVIAEGQLGDLLLLTPALRSLKDSYPGCTLAILVVQRRSYAPSGSPQALIRENPREGTAEAVASFADEIIEVSRPLLREMHGLRRLTAELSLLRRIRKGGYDTVLSCFPEDRFAVWAAVSGARRRIGQNRQPLAWLYTTRPEISKEEGGVLRYYCALALAAGASVRSQATEFRVTDSAMAEAERLLRDKGIAAGERFLLMHPGASGPFRVWPPERFARLAELVLAKEGIRTLLCGTRYDLRALRAVQSHHGNGMPEVVLEGSVGQLGGILAHAAVCVSNDSGPRHLAIALGTPSVAILPKHNERAWGIYEEGPKASFAVATGPCPLCPPDRCLDRHPDGEEFGSACIRLVSVEEVFERTRRALSS